MNVWQMAMVVGLPSTIVSALVGIAVWRFQRLITKRDKVNEDREKARTEIELSTVASVYAALDLGVATATAVSRIPDAKCNGDMHAALEKAKKVKDIQQELFVKLGVSSVQ